MSNSVINETITEAVSEWKKLGIDNANMEFSCGGDSMSDYSFTFYTKNKSAVTGRPENIEVESEELVVFFDRQIFDDVEFYVNSDGHYIGESGNVVITLNDDEDGFEYDKQSQSEWSESYEETIHIRLSNSEVEFIKNKILNINGGQDGDATFNYKIDCVITDEEEELIETLGKRLENECETYEFKDVEGEEEDWFTWSTNQEVDDVIQFTEDDKMLVMVRRNFIQYKQD
jgi:ribosomal protein S6E (S10)